MHTEFSSWLVPHGFPQKMVWSYELDFPLRRIPVCLLTFWEGCSRSSHKVGSRSSRALLRTKYRVCLIVLVMCMYSDKFWW